MACLRLIDQPLVFDSICFILTSYFFFFSKIILLTFCTQLQHDILDYLPESLFIFYCYLFIFHFNSEDTVLGLTLLYSISLEHLRVREMRGNFGPTCHMRFQEEPPAKGNRKSTCMTKHLCILPCENFFVIFQV